MAYNGYSVVLETVYEHGTNYYTRYGITEVNDRIGAYFVWDNSVNILPEFVFKSDEIRDEFFGYAYETYHKDTGEDRDECAYMLMDELIKIYA